MYGYIKADKATRSNRIEVCNER